MEKMINVSAVVEKWIEGRMIWSFAHLLHHYVANYCIRVLYIQYPYFHRYIDPLTGLEKLPPPVLAAGSADPHFCAPV